MDAKPHLRSDEKYWLVALLLLILGVLACFFAAATQLALAIDDDRGYAWLLFWAARGVCWGGLASAIVGAAWLAVLFIMVIWRKTLPTKPRRFIV